MLRSANSELVSSGEDPSLRAEGQFWLLTRLLEPEAFAVVRDGRVTCYRRRGGLTLACGEREAGFLEDFQRLNVLVETRSGRHWHYRLSPEGRALAARLAGAEHPSAHATRRMALTVLPSPNGDSLRLVNEAESPLLWLRRRQGRNGAGLLGDAEFAAGERLRADIAQAGLLPRVTADWDRPPGPGGALGAGLAPSEARLAARQRIERAWSAVGPELTGVLMDVCGFLKPIERIERERGWPARSAKIVLLVALSALARHYGYANAAVGARAARMRVWRDNRTDCQPSPSA